MSTKRLRVLIVEDHPDFLRALAWALEMLGHHVTMASDPGTGLVMARTGNSNLLMIDVHLPGMNAWQFIQQLREEGKLPAWIISMSGRGRSAGLAQSREAGCHAHLSKPFKVEELEAMLAGVG